MQTKKLGYLSGAPRVSTRANTEATGPRSHVLGVINAFKILGWEVFPYIVGDKVPEKIIHNSESKLSRTKLNMFLADLVRLGLGILNAKKAWKEIGGNVDWVYERFASMQSLGLFFKKKGIPWILETNGPFFYEAKTERKSIFLDKLAKKIEISAYKNCGVLVCISQSLKEIVVRESGINPDKVLVIPNGVDTEVFDPNKYNGYRIFPDFTIGFVGSLIAWQGLDYLIQAIADLREEGMIIHLTVVGDGPARNQWEKQVDTLNINDLVKFVGRVPATEVPNYIAGFDVCFSGQVNLKTEKMYHSPLKIYEYMSMSKPVIASDFNDARELIKGKGTGFLFNPGDLDNLKKVLREAYIKSNELPNMGKLSRENIIKNHSWVARMETMIPLVENIIRRNYE